MGKTKNTNLIGSLSKEGMQLRCRGQKTAGKGVNNVTTISWSCTECDWLV